MATSAEEAAAGVAGGGQGTHGGGKVADGWSSDSDESDVAPPLAPSRMAVDGVAKLEPIAVLVGHKDRVWHVSWSPTRQLLASCGGDCAVRLWVPDVSSKKPVVGDAVGAGGGRSASHGGSGTGSSSTGGGAGAGAGAGAGGGGNDITTKTQPWKCSRVLDGVAMRTVRMCEWSPDGRYLATASFDGAVRVWEVHSPQHAELVATLEGHENEVKCVAWSADGSLLASCGRDKSVWIWDATEVEDGGEYECVSVLHGHTQDVKFVTFHPTHNLLMSASYDDNLKVWEDADDDWINTDTLCGHSSTVWQVAFNGEGKSVASCSDDCTIRVWRRFTGASNEGAPRFKCVATITKPHERTIFSIDWSAANDAIVSGGADDAIVVHTQSSDSTDDAPGFHKDVVVTAAHAGDINCVRWHPSDPTLLASAGDDAVVRLWRYTAAGSASPDDVDVSMPAAS